MRMQSLRKGTLAAVAVSALFSVACGGGPAAPFDTLKTSNLTAFRLQNYEPPPEQQPQPAAAGMPAIPGLPPEITQWAQQAAPALQQLLPPGLLPPGMVPGQPAAAPPAQQNVPRFHGFRILSQTPVIDSDLKEELADLLGDEDNFHSEHNNCLYAEMGLSFQSGAGAATNDVLISFSCNQVSARGFAWPHANTGMKKGTTGDLSEIVAKIWPPGT